MIVKLDQDAVEFWSLFVGSAGMTLTAGTTRHCTLLRCVNSVLSTLFIEYYLTGASQTSLPGSSTIFAAHRIKLWIGHPGCAGRWQEAGRMLRLSDLIWSWFTDTELHWFMHHSEHAGCECALICICATQHSFFLFANSPDFHTDTSPLDLRDWICPGDSPLPPHLPRKSGMSKS